MKRILQKLSALFVILMFCMTSVAAADINLISPTGGEYIASENDLTITWERVEGGCGLGTDVVLIYYSDDGGLTYPDSLKISRTAAQGYYTWDLSGLADDNDYKVLLHSACMTADEVSGVFTLDSIAPVIDEALMTPTCTSEILAGGEEYDITWDSTAITDANLGSTPISLYYSVNGGERILIVEGLSNDDESYNWIVPDTLNEEVVTIILVATDLAGHETSEESCEFSVDSNHPYVTDVEFSDYEVDEDDLGTFSIYVYYSDIMDESVGLEPTLEFNPNVDSTLNCNIGSWESESESDQYYQYDCEVTDSDEESPYTYVLIDGAYDLAGNVQESYDSEDAGKYFWIDMKAPNAEISFDKNPTNGDIIVTLDFSEVMENTFVNEPEVSLYIFGDSTELYSSEGGNWSNGDTTWTENFEYIGPDSYYSGNEVTVSVEDAIDLIGNDMEIATDTFVLDNVAPDACKIEFVDIIGSQNQEDAEFIYACSEGPNAVYHYTISDGVTSTEEETGLVDETMGGSLTEDVSALSDGTLTLTFWLVDEAGNVGEESTTTTTKDTLAASVVEIVTSEDSTLDKILTEADLVENGGSGFWIRIEYSEDMDTTFNPTITFDPSLEGVLSCPSSGWDYQNNYEVGCAFTVVDTDLELEDIDITVSDALDAYGNTVESSTRADAFHVDLLEPTVTSMDVTPKPAAAGTVTIELTFSEEMDQDVPLNVDVITQAGDGDEYDVTGDFSEDGMSWEGTFYLDDYDEEGLAYTYITLGQDIAGNDMDEDIWSFAVDTVNFYILDIPGNDIGFTSSMPGFWLSINQLQATDLADYEVNTVLDATAGPLAERLTHADVNMVWAYDVDSETWASYNVDEGTGDFTEFGWTESPAWYELELKDSGQYKSIRHDDLGETEEEPVEVSEEA